MVNKLPPKDRNKNGGGKIVYVKNCIISKGFENDEEIYEKFICSELKIPKKKWCVMFSYRPPQKNKSSLFSRLSNKSVYKQV